MTYNYYTCFLRKTTNICKDLNFTILKYIKDLFKTNELLNDDYIEAIDKTINKVRIHRYNLLKNWELIVDMDSETKEFNDAVDNISTDTSTIDNTASTTLH